MKSRNLSKEKREKLINKIQEQLMVVDEGTRAIFTEVINELNRKKYGLVWEEHMEEVDHRVIENIPVFTEVKQHEISIKPEEKTNFVLEGDNLHSLMLLEKTHKGKIEVIYIDPPYNTGRVDDFVYNDTFVGEDDAFRHSKWLSFMSRRLQIAKSLLTDDGVIFIQISDIELAQLKILCDEIFGEENFINIVSVNLKNSAGASGGGEDKRLKKNIEYILIYTKSMSSFAPFNTPFKFTELMAYIKMMKEEKKSFKYTNVLYKCENRKFFKTIQDGSGDDITIEEVLDYEIKSIKQIADLENITEKEVYYKYYDKVMTTTNAQTSIRTRVWDATDNEDNMYIATYVPKTGKNKGKKTELIFKGKQKVLVIWLKDTAEKQGKTIYKKEKIGTYWDYVGETKNLSKEGAVVFNNGKKPVKLIKALIAMFPKDDITVLDFFAGSGTTAHATLALNKEDGGSRNFIMCSNNENQICEDIMLKRIKNVITGYGKTEGIPANLKYYKTGFVKKKRDGSVPKSLLEHVRELIQLENNCDIDNKQIRIAFSEDEVDSLFESDLAECKRVYIPSDVLLTSKQKDIAKNNRIEVLDIPEYYFSEELREVDEI